MVGRLIPVSLSCYELADIYIALTIAVDIFGKHDLTETRRKIAEIFYRECRDIVK